MRAPRVYLKESARERVHTVICWDLGQPPHGSVSTNHTALFQQTRSRVWRPESTKLYTTLIADGKCDNNGNDAMAFGRVLPPLCSASSVRYRHTKSFPESSAELYGDTKYKRSLLCYSNLNTLVCHPLTHRERFARGRCQNRRRWEKQQTHSFTHSCVNEGFFWALGEITGHECEP